MRTNIEIDDELVAKAMKKAGVATKRAAVEAALAAYVREPDWAFVLAMRGSDAITPDYDPKVAEPAPGDEPERRAPRRKAARRG